MSVGIISHGLCSAHEMGEHHPESPARLSSIQDQLISSGLNFVLRQYDAIPIEPDQLSLVHDTAYIDEVLASSPDEGYFPLDDDALMNPHTLTAALHAAGAGIQAVDLVMAKSHSAVFCAVRPPGHHATRNRAMGFCFFNNVAFAAAYALQRYSLTKVAILDFDVHHGNGTEDIFSGNPNVLFCSSFQYPFYPFSGVGETPANIVNTPLAASAGSAEFRQVVSERWLPALETFKPEMLFISAGFDAHIQDDISQVNLVEADYRWVTDQLHAVAHQHSQGRIVSLLEGGYSLGALARSVVAHINGLIGN